MTAPHFCAERVAQFALVYNMQSPVDTTANNTQNSVCEHIGTFVARVNVHLFCGDKK